MCARSSEKEEWHEIAFLHEKRKEKERKERNKVGASFFGVYPRVLA